MPNIKGELYIGKAGNWSNGSSARGAFSVYKDGQGNNAINNSNGTKASFDGASGEIHSGSYSNLIYGKSDTVQPPAYKVYAWKRTS